MTVIRITRDVVVKKRSARGVIGHWEQILNQQRSRIDHALRNRVARERIRYWSAVHDVASRRIEDLVRAYRLTDRCDCIAAQDGSTQARVRGEIPRALRRVGNLRNRVGGEIGLAELLKAKEEEGFVVTVVYLGNVDWTAEGEAVIVLMDWIADVIVRIGRVDGEWQPRIQDCVR